MNKKTADIVEEVWVNNRVQVVGLAVNKSVMCVGLHALEILAERLETQHRRTLYGVAKKSKKNNRKRI